MYSKQKLNVLIMDHAIMDHALIRSITCNALINKSLSKYQVNIVT